VQAGLLYARDRRYSMCVLLDGDGQHDPKYVPDLIDAVAAGRADLALGSRFLGRTDYPIPFGRRLGMSVFSALTSLITRQRITDPTSGFQAIGSNLIQFIADDHYPSDFPDADTLIRLYFAGFRISEIPVTIRRRLHGESMHSGANTLYYIYKMLFSIFIVLTQRNMLRQRNRHAGAHQTVDRSSQLPRAADYRPVRPSKAP
jgi:glycosyltransferase involved in cell wall biosynthesis